MILLDLLARASAQRPGPFCSVPGPILSQVMSSVALDSVSLSDTVLFFLCYSVHLFAVRGEAYLLWSQKSTCQSGFFSADSERERCHTYCTSDHTETTALDNHDTSVNHVCCQDNDCHHLPLLAFVILLFLKSSFTSSAHINRLTSHGALDVWW